VDATTFGADIVLIGSFVVSIGIPIYHTYGLIGDPILRVWYAVSAAMLPTVLPLLVWGLRWGRPTREITRNLVRGALTYSLPVLIVVGSIAYAGLALGLTGAGVMIYLAAVLVAVVHAPLMGRTDRVRVLVARWGAMLLTPVIVLGFTNGLPHGLDAIQGWGIPMPVIAAGAYGCVRSVNRSLSHAKGVPAA
jgi:hypothetical protein